jgi:hypothetical protein
MKILLHGIDDLAIRRGDMLRSMVFTDPGRGGLADVQISVDLHDSPCSLC